MSATKRNHFSTPQNQLAIIDKPLGHPASIASIKYLSKIYTSIIGGNYLGKYKT